MGMKPKPQDHQQNLNCPRCHSSNTKFCYYNNYSLSQPRHFCKACKRYWTRGGTLRSVPVGGGCRKNKRIQRPSFSFAPEPKSPTTSSPVPTFRSPNEIAPFTSYDFYQSQFNEVMASATSLLNFPVVSSIESENLILGGLPETNATSTNSYQSMSPFHSTPVKIEEANDLMQNKPDNGDPCMDQFSSVDSSGYWNSMGAWPDFSGYGSSVTSLI